MKAFDPRRVFMGWQWMLRRDARHLVPLGGLWAGLSAVILLAQTQTEMGLGLLIWALNVPFYAVAMALALDGDQRSLARSSDLLRRRLGDIFVVMAVADLAASIGFVFLVIPGFFVMAWLCLALPILLMESQQPVEALQTSAARTRRTYPPILGLVFIGQVAVWIVRGSLNAIAEGVSGLIVQTIVAAGVGAATGLAFIYLIAAIYSEQRHISAPNANTHH